jgi:hypothetical protein
MATMLHATVNGHSTFSPLVLCDSLLSLAEDADHAGLRATANRLLTLATAVLDERPAPRTHAAPRARAGSVKPHPCARARVVP